MTHYDLYPYPDPKQYRPEQISMLRNDFAPRAGTWRTWWPDEKEPGPKRVLVIGCGVYEALSVAAQEPLLDVTAIDSSAKTIAISQDLARQAGIKNVRFFECDITKTSVGRDYDLVIASGVMHHLRDDIAFVATVHSLMVPQGLLSIMVYGDCLRRPVEDFRKVLQFLGVKLDSDGIAFTRALLGTLPLGHPVKELWAVVNQNDAQVVDLFLHPYAKHYDAGELLALLNMHHLTLVRWFNNALKPPAMVAKQCEKLSENERARVAQILNHSDAKLAGLFRKKA